MHVIFVRARSITGIITENISYLFRKFADPTRMFSSEIQLRFSEIYVSMSRINSAGALLAYRTRFEAFPQYIRRPSVTPPSSSR